MGTKARTVMETYLESLTWRLDLGGATPSLLCEAGEQVEVVRRLGRARRQREGRR